LRNGTIEENNEMNADNGNFEKETEK
jgi:hypothetical protein